MHRALSVTACVASLAAVAIAPSWAAAATGSVTDDTAADFQAGTTGTATQVVAPGSVQLAPIREEFGGTTLPAGWSDTPWAAGGAATPTGDGQVSVDGTLLADDNASAPAGRTLEFRAKFGTTTGQHIGYGETLDNPPWAIFSTGGGPLAFGLYARTATTGNPTLDDFAITGVDPAQWHTYRIEWVASEVRYFVDGNLVHTATVTIPDSLRPVVSDLTPGDNSVVTVDWLQPDLRYPAFGAFQSRVLDTGDARSTWETLTAQGSGADITFTTRTGNTATPDASWSSFGAVGPAGEITSPMGRYMQYQATLTGDQTTTPTLDRVDAGFTVPDATPAPPPPSTGGGGPVVTVDRIAPTIHLKPTNVRVAKTGVVKLTVACPRTEKSCAVTIRLKRGSRPLAHRSTTIAGGRSRVLSLRLSHADRRKLARVRRMKVTATVTARDAAGNTKTTRKTITLLAPKR